MPDAPTPLVAGVELGGTKSLVVLAEGTTIVDRLRIPTGDPADVLPALGDRLAAWRGEGRDIAAVGIGSFGPVGLDRTRPDFGRITTTPKPGWLNTDVLGYFAGRFDLPVGFDTDVTAAALAEGRWGASQGCDVHVYLTIGTGIGAGIVVGGAPVHGLVHPEVGHLRVRRRADDEFAGTCPFHGDCIEGLAAGPAIAARSGIAGAAIPSGHPVWDDVANELAELMAALILTVSPQRIVLGGGVGLGQPRLLEAVRRATAASLAGYVAGLDVAAMDALIRPAALGDDAGPLGTVALGLDALGLR